MRVAVVGATGLVGREVTSLLGERHFPVGELTLYASEESAGEAIEFAGDEVLVRETPDAFPRFDVAFLCAPAEVAHDAAPALLAGGAFVIDLSSAHRGAEAAELAVAGSRVAEPSRRLIAIPDPLTVLLALLIRPLAAHPIRRVVVTAILSASAFGRADVERLGEQTASLMNGREPEDEPLIAFDCIPLSGDAERLVVTEIRRDLSRLLETDVPLSLAIVRAPVFHGQGASVTVELEDAIDTADVEAALRGAPSVLLSTSGAEPPSSIRSAAGGETVHVSSLRVDGPLVSFWASSDNVRQAGALSAVSVAEMLVRSRGGH